MSGQALQGASGGVSGGRCWTAQICSACCLPPPLPCAPLGLAATASLLGAAPAARLQTEAKLEQRRQEGSAPATPLAGTPQASPPGSPRGAAGGGGPLARVSGRGQLGAVSDWAAEGGAAPQLGRLSAVSAISEDVPEAEQLQEPVPPASAARGAEAPQPLPRTPGQAAAPAPLRRPLRRLSPLGQLERMPAASPRREAAAFRPSEASIPEERPAEGGTAQAAAGLEQAAEAAAEAEEAPEEEQLPGQDAEPPAEAEGSQEGQGMTPPWLP